MAVKQGVGAKWQLFFAREKDKRVCGWCVDAGASSPCVLAEKTGHGTYNAHMLTKHTKAYTAWKDAQRSAIAVAAASDDEMVTLVAASSLKRTSTASTLQISSPPSSKRTKLQPSIVDSILQAKNATLEEYTAAFFSCNGIAYHVADSPTWKSLCEIIRHTNARLPSRQLVKSATGTLAEKLRHTLVQTLVSSTTPVTVAIDGWTNVKRTKVTNLVLLCNGVAYYWRSIPNDFERNTAVWLESEITPILTDLHQRGIRYTSLVADNESVNNALFNLLLADYPFLVRVPCAAHTVQLIVHDILDLPFFNATITSVRAIITHFEPKEARLKLRTVQLSAGGKDYALVRPCTTRWNSMLACCERILKLRRFIDVIIPQSDAFWIDLSSLISYLQPFGVATDVLQRDTSTLYHVYQQMHLLLQHVDKSTLIEISAKAKARQAIQDRWEKQVNQPATIACAILSLDADLSHLEDEVKEEARRFIISFGVNYLLHFNISSLPRNDLKGALLTQYARFSGKQIAFADIDDEIQCTKKVEKERWTASIIWNLHPCELSTVAKALLGIAASEASVERTFSAQDSVHRDNRSLLHHSSVEAEMFVRFNTRALNKEQHFIHSTTELRWDADENEEEKEELQEEEEKITLIVTVPPAGDDNDEIMLDAPSPPVAAAAAAAFPRRTRSTIEAATDAFLRQYIKDWSITSSTRFNSDRLNHLTQESLNHNPGGASITELIARIREITDHSH